MHIWDSHQLLDLPTLKHKEETLRYKWEHFAKEKESWDKKGFIFYQRGALEMALECYERTGKHQNVCAKLRAEILYQRAE